jgi:hypothetical protein
LRNKLDIPSSLSVVFGIAIGYEDKHLINKQSEYCNSCFE